MSVPVKLPVCEGVKVRLTNAGGSDLDINSLVITGANATDFDESSSPTGGGQHQSPPNRGGRPGWDNVTGLGTPNGLPFINAAVAAASAGGDAAAAQ